jgi:DNA-binding transcriptional ArsR family regulator
MSAAAKLDLAFHALSDPTRRAMVRQLSRGAASVSALAKPLSISLPAVMQHLHVLEASGIVRSHKIGRVRTCSVEPKMLTIAERWIAERRADWEHKLDRLATFLDATDGKNDNDDANASEGGAT